MFQNQQISKIILEIKKNIGSTFNMQDFKMQD